MSDYGSLSPSRTPAQSDPALAPRQEQPSRPAQNATPTPSENSLAGATTSHERAEHPLKTAGTISAASVRLETSVRFSGAIVSLENEDLGAKTAHWRKRQEHVDATDFYRFVENGGSHSGRENTVVGKKGAVINSALLESVVKDGSYGAADITAGTAVEKIAIDAKIPLAEKMVTIVGKRAIPPQPSTGPQSYASTGGSGPSVPVLPPKIPAYKAWFGAGGNAVPRIPPKVPIIATGNQDVDDSFDPQTSNYTTSPARWTHRTASPPPPPQPYSPSVAATSSTQASFSPGEPSGFSYRREADKIISKYTKSLSYTSPSDKGTEALIDDINKQIDREFKNLNLTDGQKINSIAQYVYQREKLKASQPLEPKTRSFEDPPSSKKSRRPMHQPSTPSSERLDLHSTMTSMQKAGIGSRTSLKLGLDFTMRYYTNLPSNNTLNSTHLTSIISNFSKPRGRGLAELSMGFSFMHMCIRLNKLELVKELIEVGGANLKECDDKTQTLMRNAIWYADADMVEYLISKGEDINARSHHDSISPLHHAVAAHKLKTVKVLVEAGADVNATIRKNRKDIATICRHKDAVIPGEMMEILALLLRNGGKLTKSPDGGITPALLTGASGDEGVLAILAASGVDSEDLEKLRDFELSSAILYNDVGKVRELIARGVNLNRRDIFRWRPLDSAISYKRTEMEEMLAAAGAKPASSKKAIERKKKREVDSGGEEADERRSSDAWSAAAMGDRSDPEEWEREKDLRSRNP